MHTQLLFILCFIYYWGFTYSQHGIDDPSSASIYPNSFHSLSRKQDTYDYVLIYRGFCYSSSGYGQEARSYIKALLALGVPIYLDPQERHAKVPTLSDAENEMLQKREIKDPEKFAKEQKAKQKYVIAIHHTAPDLVKPVEWADYNIARTMWEMDDFPTTWVTPYHYFDEVWVPSRFNERTFVAGGIRESSLWTIGECMDDEHYSIEAMENNKNEIKITGKRKVNFFSLFNWNYRKGWDVLVTAFAKEFPPSSDVALFIKTFSSWGKTAKDFKADIKRVLRITGEFPSNIILLNAGYDEKDMPFLYQSFDAFVLPTRAEGWGRPTMEAMISGVPVITTKYSAQEEFVTARNAYVISHTIVDVSEEAAKEVLLFNGGRWAEPSVVELQKYLKQLAKSTKDAKKKAKIARANVLENFMCSTITSKMRDRLDEVVSKLKRRQ